MHHFTLLLFLLVAGAPAVAAPSLAEPPAAVSGGQPLAGAGGILITVDEALALAFPGCELERGTVYLTDVQRKHVERLAGSSLSTSIIHPYVARIEGKLVGTAFVDVHKVRAKRESLFVVVSPEGRVKRLEVLAFAEPHEYIPRANWYGQFKHQPLTDDLNLDRGIRGVTGATLTARATTRAVRRALALHAVLGPAAQTGPVQ